jgi:glycerol-3-phosphate acyltransferase PlsY
VTRAAIAILLAYLLGSVSFAYLAGRARGFDLRRHGSGNLGATNVLRTLGLVAAVVVLTLDLAKGVAAVALMPRLAGAPDPWVPVACGLAAIAGHVWPVFLRWRGGGKGVATSAGVFGALAPLPFILAVVTFALVVAVSRYMSLGSLAAAVVLPTAMAFDFGPRHPLFFVSLGVAAFVFWTHRSNLDRLRRGVEPRLGRKVAT